MLNDSLKDLQEMTKTLGRQIETSMKIFDQSVNEALKQVPEQDASRLEKLKASAANVMNLAKEGKIAEAQNIIINMQNECKNNK